jgi:tetratricopeptide (TPR) repeat protein
MNPSPLNEPIVAQVQARWDQGMEMVSAGRTDEAYEAFSSLAQEYASHPVPELKFEGLKALYALGSLQFQLERTEDALASYVAVAEAPVAVMALMGKGWALDWAGRSLEAEAAYRAVLDRFGGDPRVEVESMIPAASLNLANLLACRGDSSGAIAILDKLLQEYDASDDPEIATTVERAREVRTAVGSAIVDANIVLRSPQVEAATSLVLEASQLAESGQLDATIARSDEVIRRFSGADYASLQLAVASAVYNKAIALRDLGRLDDSVVQFDDLLQRFGSVADESVRTRCAIALFNKGIVLGKAGHPEEALVTFTEVDSRYGRDEAAPIRQRVVRALAAKADILLSLNRASEGLAARAGILRRFAASSDEVIHEVIAALQKQQELVSFGAIFLGDTAAAGTFSLADTGLGMVLDNPPAGVTINNVISIVDPEPARELSDTEQKQLSESVRDEMERFRKTLDALQRPAMEILSRYAKTGAPFALFLRNFDLEGHYARSAAGRMIVTQQNRPAGVENRLHDALRRHVPIIGIANPSVVRSDFDQAVPKIIVPDDLWEHVLLNLLLGADIVIMELTHVTPGVAIELQAILDVHKEALTVLLLPPKDAPDRKEEFSTWLEGTYAAQRAPQTVLDEAALLARFPRVVREDELNFDALDTSTPFRDLIERIHSLTG